MFLPIYMLIFSFSDRILDLIKSGGFYINQQRVNNPDTVLGDGNYVLHNDVTLIRLGQYF